MMMFYVLVVLFFFKIRKLHFSENLMYDGGVVFFFLIQKLHFSENSIYDGGADRPKDGRTDTTSYRVTRKHVKINVW